MFDGVHKGHQYLIGCLKESAARQGCASGVITFTQTADGVKIVADITGLKANRQHGFHIHQYGDATLGNGKSAGGHYNPEKHAHASPTQKTRHAGDLGNLQADNNGNAHYERTVKNLTIAGLRNPIIGRGVIIHAKKDDFGQPTGNAGARIAI
ncbi:MAG: superoxide dismutase family protein, partial [Chloroflexi bacterium]|nr:superoxide dismutase family protein [Chloroflexota bacterium]